MLAFFYALTFPHCVGYRQRRGTGEGRGARKPPARGPGPIVAGLKENEVVGETFYPPRRRRRIYFFQLENEEDFAEMLTRVITLRFNGLLDSFDDAPLRDFLKDKEVVSVRDHFFMRNEQPYLAVLVNYTLKPLPTEVVNGE